MTGRKPEAWQTNAAGPFSTLRRERGEVTIWTLGEDRYAVEAPDASHEVIGVQPARELAHKLAAELGPAISLR